jgi:tetratricopeptide (TPR) repeat protein
VAKILKINNDADYYYERGITKSDSSEFIDAIDSFYQALEREGENIWIYSEIAGNFLELDLVEPALKIYYRIIALDKKADIGYLGVMQCLVKQNLLPQAFFYLNMGVQNGALSSEFELDDEFFEEEEPRLKLSGKNDGSDMVAFARKLMVSGDVKYARQMLESVPKEARQYTDARNYLALIALGENETGRALAITDEILLQDDTDIPALTTRIVAYDIEGNDEKKREALRFLDSLRLTSKSDINKAAVCMQQIQNSELAVKFLRQALAFQPYDRNILLLLSIAENNCKNHRRARGIMLTLRKLYRDDMVVRYYARLFNKAYNKILEMTTELPEKIKNFRISYIKSRITALKTADAVARDLAENERFYEAVMWLFQSNELGLMGQTGALLAEHPDWRPFIRELLIDPDIHYRVKKECLLAYLRRARDKKFFLLVGDVMQHFKPRLPAHTGDPRLIDAYWQLYTTLAFIDSDFDKRLAAAYRELSKTVKLRDFGRFDLRPATLAAVMANCAGIHKIFDSPTDCCEIFDCDETEMRTYMDVLKLTPREKTTDRNGRN